MVAVHVGELHTAKELLLGQMLGNVGQVQGSLPVVALIQVIFVLKDFLGREGQDNFTSPATKFSSARDTPSPTAFPAPTGSPISAIRSCKLVRSLLLAHQAPGLQETRAVVQPTKLCLISSFSYKQLWAARGGYQPPSIYLPPCNTVLGAGVEI